METLKWIACEDEMPDADTTVLIANIDWPGDPVYVGFFDGTDWRASEGMSLEAAPDSGASDAAPTHWMHLPEPPAEEGR